MAKTIVKASEQAEAKPAESKKTQNVVEAKPTKGSALGYRIGAIVLWLVAIGCEIFAIMALMKNFTIRFTHNGNTNMVITLILFIVLDLIFAICAAQLWKKANHIDPPSEKNKFVFYLVSELGVIMACICFIPLIIILIKNDKLDKKSKLIVTIVAIVALLITGVASADFNPISKEEKEAAEAVITEDVYWTPFGHKYHLNHEECPYLQNSSTVIEGKVQEAIESGRTALCSYCANHFASEELKAKLNKINVEEVLEDATKSDGGSGDVVTDEKQDGETGDTGDNTDGQ